MRIPRTVVLLACLSLISVARAQILNASRDLVPLGIAAKNMTPNQSLLDSTPLLVAAVNYARSNGFKTLTVDKGAYYFLTAQYPNVVHVTLPNVDGMTIDFEGSDLIFTQPQVGGIWLQNSKNAVLQNFTLDYSPLPFTQLRVISVDPVKRTLTYTPLPNWPDATVYNQITPGQGFYFFVYRNGHPAPDLSRMQATPPFSAGSFNIGNEGPYWGSSTYLARIRPGDTVVLTARGGSDPVQADSCNGCTLRNIRIYSAWTWALDVVNSQNTTVDHVYVMPMPGTDRLISTNADGVTLGQPGPNNTFRLNRAIRTLDDGISPHSLAFGTVKGQSGRQVQMSRQYANSVATGSPVAFENSGDGSILGTAVILSQNPPSVAAVGETVVLTMDRDLPPNLTGATVYTTDPVQRGTGTVVERNAVEDQGFARGMTLWGLMNSVARGNYVFRPAWDFLLGTHRMGPVDWVSPPFVNLEISRNVFDSSNNMPGSSEWIGGIKIEGAGRPGFQLLTASPNSNVQILRNFIADSGYTAARVESSTNAVVTGNYLLNPNLLPCVNGKVYDNNLNCQPEYLQPVAAVTSISPVLGPNTVDQTSGRAYVTDKTFNRLAAYAPGAVVRVNAYNLGLGGAPTAKLTDADGKEWTAAVQGTAVHSVDVQLPPGAGLGGAYLTVTVGNVVHFGTLFLDNVDNIAATNGCSYWAGASANSVPATGGKVQVLIVTQDGCAYQAASLSSFATLTGNGTGTAVVEATLAANTDLARLAVLEAAGYQIHIQQSGIINYAYFQPATAAASLGSGTTPDKAVDGNIQTNWSLGAVPPGWIEIALPANAVVATVRLTCRVGTQGTQQTIRISARHTDNTLVAVKDLTMTNNDFDVVAIPLDTPITGATAIRIDTLAQNPTGFPAWREIEFLSPGLPAITSVNSVTGTGPVIAANTWVEIHGTNLAPRTRLWQAADFSNGQMPQALDGVSATVNGKPAFVEYISGAQVNVLTPLDTATGSVQVQLTSGGYTAPAVTATEQTTDPGFFVFGIGPYLAATHADGSYVGPASLYPGFTTPAKPGEVIVLWANGFGPTTPPVVNGSAVQRGDLPALPQVTIGGTQAEVQFAGVVTPGLYQFNVQVPANAPDGDLAVIASYGGYKTQAGLMIPVHR